MVEARGAGGACLAAEPPPGRWLPASPACGDDAEILCKTFLAHFVAGCARTEEIGGAIVKVCVLASSSAGNATFVATDNTCILIDAGLSRKEVFQRMARIGEDAARLDAVLVTHEHSDHVCGLVPLLKKLQIPVYMSRLTAPSIPWGEYTPQLETFQAGERFRIGDFEVSSFTIPHVLGVGVRKRAMPRTVSARRPARKAARKRERARSV